MFSAGVSAQDLTGHNWYFGSGQRDLRFGRSDNLPSLVTNQATPFGNGGSAVASDPVTGNLLFYTDGQRVYNWAHTAMFPGSALMGDPTQNQPVAICRIPGRRSSYYIFHRQGGVLRYTVVDVLDPGDAPANTPPQGEIDFADSLNQTIPGYPGNLTEAMTIIPHSNGTDFFLLTQTAISATTSAYVIMPITAAGFGAITQVTPANSTVQQAANFNVKTVRGVTRIAVAPKETNTNVEVLTFDEATPGLTAVRIPFSGVASMGTEAIYDTEFSSDGQFLYVSVSGNLPGIAPAILQYDLTDLSVTAGTITLPATVDQSFGLQMGPDSVIYHLYQDGANFFLGSFNDTIASAVTYNPLAFPGNFGGKQFPSFAPYKPVLQVSFVVDGTCQNSPIAFYPTVVPGADSLVWNLGDGTTTSDWSPVHTYTTTSATVTVTAFLNGQSVASAPQALNLTSFDTEIQLVQDTTACTCELPYSKTATTYPPPRNTTPCNGKYFELTATITGSGSANWTWFGPAGQVSTGSGTSALLRPDSAGYYYLIADVGGCQAYAGVNIKEYGVPDQRANIWYFGNHAGLDFNPLPDDPVKAISNTVMNAPEGTSTISDQNGQVVFFTDGDKVWGPGPPASNFPELADDIGGDPAATQSALIVPVPGDQTLYYIFTTKEIYGTGRYVLSYSLFDRKVPPLGAVVQKNIKLFESSTERVTASATGWVIAHEYGNNTFRAYRVTGQGISNPTFSSIGSDHSFGVAANGEGYMKMGPQNRLAVALPNPGVSNTIEVFDFVDSTGTVTNLRTLTLNSTGKVYGIEFSGDKLFATLSAPGASRLYEFVFNAAGVPSEINPLSPPAPNNNPQSATVINEELGAIQLGPDGMIYVAANGKQYLGTILPNGSPTALSQIVFNQRPLAAGTTSTLGLPNFAQIISQPVQGPGLNIADFCLGDSTHFTGAGTDVIDYFVWYIDDVVVKQGFNETSYAHLFNTAGSHRVRLTIENRCVGVFFDETRTFTINAPPPMPTPLVVPMCTPPLTLDANTNGTPNLTYLWQTGATTETIDVTTPGEYSVTITSTTTTCTTDATFTASQVMPQVDLGPDVSQCTNGVDVTLDTHIATTTHEWSLSINGGAPTPLAGNGNTQVVHQTTPGQYTYIVKVNDPRGPVPPATEACFTTDQVVFTIYQAPVFTTAVTPPTVCAATDGSIQVNITQPAGPFTSIFNGGAPLTNQTTPIVFANLGGGTYAFSIQDEASGCVTPGSASIGGTDFTVTPVVQNNVCAASVVEVTTSLPSQSPIHFTIVSTTGQLIANNQATTTDLVGTFETPPLGPGEYNISVLADASGCTVASTITLNAGTPIAGVLTLDACGVAPFTATATPTGANFTYTWSGTAFTTPPANTLSTVNMNLTAGQTGTVIVTIHDNTNAQCDVTLTQQATIFSLTPTFSFDQCAPPPITLSANETSATYLYTWHDSPTSGGPKTVFANSAVTTLGTPPSRHFVTLEITDLSAACPSPDNRFPSVEQQINVLGPITTALTVAPTNPCEGSQFTITAIPDRVVTGFAWKKDGQLLPRPVPQNVLTTIGGGVYTVTVDADALPTAGCPTEETITISTTPTDPGDLNDEYVICPSETNPDPNTRQVILDPGDGTSSYPNTDYIAYQWYKYDDVGNPVDLLGETNRTLVVDKTNGIGRYGVRLTSDLCEITDETDVFLECEPVITGPNAFRPGSKVTVGGNLTNEQFRLFTFFIEDTDFQVYIFNRWGEMVFTSTQREFEWNGGYNNNSSNLLPAGTYTYVVRYRSTYRPDYGVREKRGGVVLMR